MDEVLFVSHSPDTACRGRGWDPGYEPLIYCFSWPGTCHWCLVMWPSQSVALIPRYYTATEQFLCFQWSQPPDWRRLCSTLWHRIRNFQRNSCRPCGLCQATIQFKVKRMNRDFISPLLFRLLLLNCCFLFYFFEALRMLKEYSETFSTPQRYHETTNKSVAIYWLLSCERSVLLLCGAMVFEISRDYNFCRSHHFFPGLFALIRWWHVSEKWIVSEWHLCSPDGNVTASW